MMGISYAVSVYKIASSTELFTIYLAFLCKHSHLATLFFTIPGAMGDFTSANLHLLFQGLDLIGSRFDYVHELDSPEV